MGGIGRFQALHLQVRQCVRAHIRVSRLNFSHSTCPSSTLHLLIHVSLSMTLRGKAAVLAAKPSLALDLGGGKVYLDVDVDASSSTAGGGALSIMTSSGTSVLLSSPIAAHAEQWHAALEAATRAEAPPTVVVSGKAGLKR